MNRENADLREQRYQVSAARKAWLRAPFRASSKNRPAGASEDIAPAKAIAGAAGPVNVCAPRIRESKFLYSGIRVLVFGESSPLLFCVCPAFVVQ